MHAVTKDLLLINAWTTGVRRPEVWDSGRAAYMKTPNLLHLLVAEWGLLCSISVRGKNHDQSYTTDVVQCPVHACKQDQTLFAAAIYTARVPNEHDRRCHVRVCLEHHLHSGGGCLT